MANKYIERDPISLAIMEMQIKSQVIIMHPSKWLKRNIIESIRQKYSFSLL